ncbi:hypothetical protein DY000_02018074 [Brassica cretica]|uniref:Uncharacterized protein n=1 Tax=Brassica cretica TaxID=69181 RepID=A0ABQ7D4Q0_BRACR|nr:hypothetical protein DY000_02018074 [Brassica cretica]
MTAFVKRSVSSLQSASPPCNRRLLCLLLSIAKGSGDETEGYKSASHREVSLRQDLQPVSGGDRTQTPHFLGIGLSFFPAKFDSFR